MSRHNLGEKNMKKNIIITKEIKKFLLKFSQLTIHGRLKVLNKLKKEPELDELYLMCLSISGKIDLGVDQKNLPELILGEQNA